MRHDGGRRTLLQSASRETFVPDEPAKRSPADGTRISLQEGWEVTYWCVKFGCTETQLRDAVASVGVSANRVEEYLKRR